MRLYMTLYDSIESTFEDPRLLYASGRGKLYPDIPSTHSVKASSLEEPHLLTKKKDNISRRLTVTFWESAQPREDNAGRHQKRKRKKKTIYLDCHILGERTAAGKHQKKENEKKACT